MSSPRTGVFVVFEGGDGAGKSTQARMLARWLADERIDHRVTFEPGDTWLGARVRELVLSPDSGPIGARAEFLLYAADKAQHVDEVLWPALREGHVVISDRYVDSTLAYQGAGRDLTVDDLAGLSAWATAGLVPDLTVLLDVDPERAVHTKADPDRLESAGREFHARARQLFLDLAAREPGRYLVLDGRAPREEIAAQVRSALTEAMERAGIVSAL